MIKEAILFILALIVLSLFVHSKLSVQEGFSSESLNYLSNGTMTKLFGIQNFKLSDNNQEYLVFNGVDSYIKIPSVNSSDFVISFKLKSQKENNFLLAGSNGSFNLRLVNGNLKFGSPELESDYVDQTNIGLDKPYVIELGIKNKQGYLKLDDNKNTFKLNDKIRVTDIFVGRNFASSQFFEGEIGDLKIVKESENKLVNIDSETESKKCNWNPLGVSKQECIENCELFTGCEGKTEECTNLCYNCTDEGKCEWLKNQCNFSPEGKDYTDCVYKCVKKKNCSWETCVDKCANCGVECPWIKEKNENLQKYYEPPKQGEDGAPGRPRIRVETSTGMVSIYWVAPDSGMAPIETYIYFLYKTFKRNEGVKIGLVPFPKCRNCFHVIDGLEPNETYSVGIRAYNSLDGKGSLSKMSNIETFKPKLERIKNDIGVISLDTLSNNDAYMNNYHYCNN